MDDLVCRLVQRDPRIVELAWATIAVPADGPRLVRAQQLLCDL